MTPGDIIALLTGLFQFPTEILAIIKILRATPEQQHQDVIAGAQKEADSLAQTGRPTWGPSP